MDTSEAHLDSNIFLWFVRDFDYKVQHRKAFGRKGRRNY